MNEKKEPPIRYPLRLSPELYERLKALAAKERRSINQQIIHLLMQILGEEEQD
ncbi:MAG: toxin-antitoxin system HicB family antitoxin [Ardenticatenales bacterium]|nr:toxin-antitoxin system HicB family antitoxin [Ardenticatenales bacterium]